MSAQPIRSIEALPSIAQALAEPDESAGMSGTGVPIFDIGIAPTPEMRSSTPFPRLAGKTVESATPISTAMRPPTTHVRSAREPELEQKFRRLVEQWREETEHVSSIAKASMHPAYQHIIGMGYYVVSLLLRELQEDPDHWFWALKAITEQDPAQSEDTFEGAVKAWLKWGKENHYL